MKRFFSFVLAFSLLFLIDIRCAGAEMADDTATGFTVPSIEGYELDFECDSAVSQLYFVWGTAPGGWTLTAIDDSGKETAYECGKYGFLHEYIKLDSHAAKYRFTFSRVGPFGLKGSVYAFGDGEPPSWVEQWLPPCEKADLLVFSARQGDEYLYFGGALPYYADKGKNIQVAYALNGDEDEDINPHGLLSGLYSVGVQNYPVIEYVGDEDGGDGARTAFYAEQLRRFKPEVALGLREEANEGLAAAVDISGKDEEYPESTEEYGAWDVPKTYLHGLGGNETIMDWHVPLKKHGGKTAAEAALEAYLIQFPSDAPTNARGFVILHGNNKFGLYRSTVRADVTGGDFFENTSQAVPLETVAVRTGPNVEAPAEPAATTEIISGAADEPAKRANSGRDNLFLPILGVSALLCLALAFTLRAKRDT